MATQTVEFRAASGATLTAKLFSVGSDTVVQTASAVTEATNRKGTYSATFTDPGAAEFELVAFSGSIPVCRWFVTLTLTTATFQAYEVRTQAVVSPVTVGTNNDKTGYSLTQGFPANFAALGINSSGHVSRVTLVDTTTTNSDMRGTDGAALASAWTATRAGYLDSVLIAANSNRTVQVTGSNHVAADIHELQAGVITAADFSPDWFTAAGIASDAVTEIQSGLATSANQVILIDRVSYALTALVGACSDAQTAAETYTLSIGGNTYTLDYSGLDASGNRSTTTLSKA